MIHISRFIMVVAAVGLLTGGRVQAAEFVVDPGHSQVLFKIKHLSISTVSGQFKTFSGTCEFEPGKAESLKLNGKIVVSSIDTNNEKRDAHLKGPDFFDAKKYPEMTYVTTKVTAVGKDGITLEGKLTMRGVTKKIILKGTLSKVIKDPRGKTRMALSATGKINRKDFGIAWNKTMETGALVLGESVSITLEFELIKKD